MNTGTNKDVLIAVLQRENEELKKLCKLQAEQLPAYREQVEGYKYLQTMMQQTEETNKGLSANYESQIDMLGKVVENQRQLIDALNARIKELDATGEAEDPNE